MRLVRMIYASRATKSMELKDFGTIKEAARKKNSELGVTGLLCYDTDFFLQWLEGPRGAVDELYDTILRDWRHDRVTLLDFGEVDHRCFSHWSMGFVSSEHLDKELVLKYSATNKFDPYSMGAKSVRDFMIEFGRREAENLGH
mgnify:CR=1 FL=1